jgi:hypothetical protein
MDLKRDPGQPDQSGPHREQPESPQREKGGQQHDQAGGTPGVPRGERVAIKPRVEPPSFSRWALATEKPLEHGDGCTGDQRPDQHTCSEITPGRVSPEKGDGCAEQPERAVAAVGDDERQLAHEARPTRDGKARRCLPIKRDELLQSVCPYEAWDVRASRSARAISNWNGLSTSIPTSA